MSRIDQIKILLEQEPQDSFLNYALALELSKAGDDAKAIALIEQVLARDPNYLGAYLTIGKLYEKKGRTGDALDAYRKGTVVAKKLNNLKALAELNEALQNLE